MAQVVKQLPNKCKALSSNPSITEKKKVLLVKYQPCMATVRDAVVGLVTLALVILAPLHRAWNTAEHQTISL
jgi:hypothetical protein